MTYNVIVTKFLDVPKNLFVENFDNENSSIETAKNKLLDLDGDYAVVIRVENGVSKIIHRFEKTKN